MAADGGRGDDAASLFERSFALFEQEGQLQPAARVSARIGELVWNHGRGADAIERMERSFAVLAGDAPDESFAVLAAQLGRFLFFSGEVDTAIDRIEVALELAEAYDLPEVLSAALNTKALTLIARERRREGAALMRHALEIALDHELPSAALRAYYNLADVAIHADAAQDGQEFVMSGLALARRVGNRYWEWSFLAQTYPLLVLGEWDEVLDMSSSLSDEAVAHVRVAMTAFLGHLPIIHVHRGELDKARSAHERFPEAGEGDDVQERAEYAVGSAAIALAEGRTADALSTAMKAFDVRGQLGIGAQSPREGFILAVETALVLGDRAAAESLLKLVEQLPRGNRPQYLEAHARRFRARLAAAGEQPTEAEQRFKRAAAQFRELAAPFWLAVTLLEYGEWLAAEDRGAESTPLLDEARGLFERLAATPWLERLALVAGRETASV